MSIQGEMLDCYLILPMMSSSRPMQCVLVCWWRQVCSMPNLELIFVINMTKLYLCRLESFDRMVNMDLVFSHMT